MVRMAGVGAEWSHSMAHALALDARTWPRGDVPGLGLTDEDVGLLRGMGDRPGSLSRVRTSEYKVRRKDMCWSMRGILDVLEGCQVCGPGLGEAGRYSGIRADPRCFTGACGRSCAGMVRMAGVGAEWSHSMAHALALDARTWPRGDVPGLGLTDEDVGLLRG
ncbi:hypothetical protein EJB05_55814, partial [Eragrostis curvula]